MSARTNVMLPETIAQAYDAITVSPITAHEDNGWTWTVTTAELNMNDEDNPRRVPVSTTYRTDSNGQGLWIWAPSGAVEVDRNGAVTVLFHWRQILGFSQFNLNCSPSTRRERILGLALDTNEDREGMTWRQIYATRPRIS